ncbi:MAG: DinB family protein [Acidobacteriaceae bacterium]|nr:DinB family protein [Acidobacteriaceae bacterium]
MKSRNSSETARIADQLDRAFKGEAWHGPALLEILADVNAATVSARHIPDGHSIWELVLHISAWEGAILRRMQGEELQLKGSDDFPQTQDASEAAWQAALEKLNRKHNELLAAITAMPDSRLAEQVPGKDYDFYFMLHGAVQHALYHAGQIALLKKFRS